MWRWACEAARDGGARGAQAGEEWLMRRAGAYLCAMKDKFVD